jgi:hypothetical protein
MDGWMDEWMDGWMNGWMVWAIYFFLAIKISARWRHKMLLLGFLRLETDTTETTILRAQP